ARAWRGPQCREYRRVEVRHVDRAAAVQVPVDDLRGERVLAPVGGLRGYDVEVTVYEQRRLATGVVAPPGDQTRAPRRGLVNHGLDPDLAEQLRDVLGRLPLPRARVVPVVGRVDPDQVTADLRDLGGRIVGWA